MAHRLKFNQSFLFPMAFALLGALFLPSEFGGWVRSAMTTLVYPVSATVRGAAGALDSHVAAPRRPLSETSGGEKSFEQLQNELETLKSQFIVLQNVCTEQQTRLDERKDWPKDLLKLCKVVQVIGGDAGTQQALTLQPGVLDNPVQNSAVLVGFDIVGRLNIVGPGAAKVTLLTDRSSVVQGEFTHYLPDGSGVQRMKLFTNVTGDGNGRMIAMGKLAEFTTGADKHWKVNVGDRVVLSDGDWPTTIQSFCLGEVESISVSSRPLFCNIVIRPRRDLMKLKDVMVLKK